jgi:hypothetical protein
MRDRPSVAQPCQRDFTKTYHNKGRPDVRHNPNMADQGSKIPITRTISPT